MNKICMVTMKLVTLKQQLKNVLLVMILEKKQSYGTDAQVMEFGCVRNLVGGSLLMATCAAFAVRCPSFVKLFIFITFNAGLLLLLRLYFSL